MCQFKLTSVSRRTEFACVALLSGARHLVGDLDRSEEVGTHSLGVTTLLLRLQEVVAVRRVPVVRRVALIDRIPAQQGSGSTRRQVESHICRQICDRHLSSYNSVRCTHDVETYKSLHLSSCARGMSISKHLYGKQSKLAWLNSQNIF